MLLLSSFHLLLATHDCQLGVAVGNRRTGSFGMECLFLVTEDGVTVHHRDPLIATVRRSPTPSARATAPAAALLAGWLTVLLPAPSPFSATLAGTACVDFLAPACLQRWQSFLLGGVSFLAPPPPTATACAARPAGVAFKQSSHLLATPHDCQLGVTAGTWAGSRLSKRLKIETNA